MYRQVQMTEEKRINLEYKFPEMTPVKGPPPLITINGCGCGMYGKRDWDEESKTYVSTLCICLVFIPIISLAAYRVAKSKNGWYFLGKVPLSGFARTWNNIMLLIVLALIGIICWRMHVDSQSYKDKQTLLKAEHLEKEGQTARAVIFYSRLYFNSPEQKEVACKALRNIYDACEKKGAGKNSLNLLEHLVQVDRRTKGKLFPDFRGLVLKQTKECLDSNPTLGLEYLNLARKLRVDKSALDKLYRRMLEKCVATNPQNVDAVLKLVGIYESERNFDKCEKILMPVKGKIASTEGARILGKIMLRKKNYDEAYKLLHPYVKAKMKTFRKARVNYVNELKKAQKRALAKLNGNPDSKAYREISRIRDKKKRKRKLDEYLSKWMKKDSSVKKSLDEYIKAASFVPSAIELGMLQLERARTVVSVEERKKELEAAERTFVAIAPFASGSDEYKLSLGEVYYWLGKDSEGEKQFDGYLTSRKRDARALLYLADIYRRIGKTGKVYKLAKEVFDKKEVSSKEKDQAVFLLSQTCLTNTEKIYWLEKLDKTNDGMLASLYSTKADLAIENGDDGKARKFLEKSIAVYEKMPETATLLNNLSLIYSSLYAITGEPEDLAKSAKMIVKAVDLNPRGAILLLNAVSSLIKSSVIKVIADKVDLRKLRSLAGTAVLNYLYCDKAGRQSLYQAIRETDSYKKALEFNSRLYILAPKNINVYVMGMMLAAYSDSRSRLKTLLKIEEMLKKASPDVSKLKSYTRDFYSGKRDGEIMKTLKGNLKKYRLMLKNLYPEKDPLCFAVMAATVTKLERKLNKYESRSNQNEILSLAEKAFKCSSSAGTARAYRNALAYCVLKKLTETNPGFQKISVKAKRCLASYELIAYIAVSMPEAAGKLASDPNTGKILKLLHLKYDMLPAELSVNDWAVAKLLEPAFAEKIKDRIVNNKVKMEEYRISYDFFSYAVSTQLDEYILETMLGKKDDAEKVLKKARAEHSPFFSGR